MILALDHLLPYWVVDGKIYHNQFETWMAIGQGDIGRAKFNFYDAVYDTVNWEIEPSQSWDDLVRQRCQQLRDKYQHLCLLYSGGRDSHHLLRSFAKFKIPLDEIVIIDFTLNRLKHAEVDSWMMPMAYDYVENHNPLAKVSRICVDKQDYDDFFTEIWTEKSFVAGMTGQYQPGNLPWLTSRHLSHLPSGAGVILGTDKPKLFLENNQIWSVFHDTVFEWYVTPNLSFEFFYFTPDLPSLHVKQCHMIVNWWEQNMPWIDAHTINKFINHPHSEYYDSYNIACGRGPAADISFSGQNGKNKYTGNHPAFQIIQRHARENQWLSFHHWEQSYNWIKRHVPQAFDYGLDYVNYKSENNRIIKTIKSKPRKIRSWIPKTNG